MSKFLLVQIGVGDSFVRVANTVKRYHRFTDVFLLDDVIVEGRHGRDIHRLEEISLNDVNVFDNLALSARIAKRKP